MGTSRISGSGGVGSKELSGVGFGDCIFPGLGSVVVCVEGPCIFPHACLFLRESSFQFGGKGLGEGLC